MRKTITTSSISTEMKWRLLLN